VLKFSMRDRADFLTALHRAHAAWALAASGGDAAAAAATLRALPAPPPPPASLPAHKLRRGGGAGPPAACVLRATPWALQRLAAPEPRSASGTAAPTETVLWEVEWRAISALQPLADGPAEGGGTARGALAVHLRSGAPPKVFALGGASGGGSSSGDVDGLRLFAPLAAVAAAALGAAPPQRAPPRRVTARELAAEAAAAERAGAEATTSSGGASGDDATAGGGDGAAAAAAAPRGGWPALRLRGGGGDADGGGSACGVRPRAAAPRRLLLRGAALTERRTADFSAAARWPLHTIAAVVRCGYAYMASAQMDAMRCEPRA
jgi:hypothetical protein